MRVPGYDYSTPGTYMVTLCIETKACILAQITDGLVNLSERAHMVDGHWQTIPARFPGIDLDSYVIMPNHMHGILRFGWELGGSADSSRIKLPSLPKVVQWFKSITTSSYRKQVTTGDWTPFPGRLWQRDYWDDTIETDSHLDRAREYIAGNPGTWLDDRLHKYALKDFPLTRRTK